MTDLLQVPNAWMSIKGRKYHNKNVFGDGNANYKRIRNNNIDEMIT